MPIVHTLKEFIKKKCDRGSWNSYKLTAICKCEFISSVFIIESFHASLFIPLSINLQSTEVDIFDALETVDSVTTFLKQGREYTDSEL